MPSLNHEKLNSVEDAVKQAIDGGWKSDFKAVRGTDMFFADGSFWLKGTDGSTVLISYEQILIDPLFWQALGKARGWGEKWNIDGANFTVWKERANSWFRNRMSCGDENDFWQSLP